MSSSFKNFLMKNRLNIISIILIAVFFLIGWEAGISPLTETISKIKQSGENIRRKIAEGPFVNIPAGYISKKQYKIDILHYDLNIDLYPEKKLLKGDAVLTGVLLDNSLNKIDLNFYDNLKISAVQLNGKNSEYINENTRLSVPLGNFSLDTFRLRIIYEGTPERRGLGAFTFGEIYKRSLVYNLNEPAYASTWFPCNDLPSDKALLDIKISNDTSAVSVSNGVLVDTLINENRKTYHWKTFYPISTYLICVYSSEYKNFSDEYISQDKKDTMKIQYYVLPEHLEYAKIDFKDHPKITSFFAKTFGEYPFIKEKYGVAEFLWQIGAMEHQTITGVGSNFVNGRNFFKDIYIHELAHQWFGDAVGPKTWKDIWLNEGFASYSEALYFENLAGSKALQSTMLSKYQDSFSNTVYNPGSSLFSSTVYDKGAWVLHMLRREVGDSVFFKILKTYFNEYKFKTASTADFINVCENVSNKNLEKFFDQWVFTGKENINLKYKWHTEKSDNRFIVFIELNQSQKYGAFNFPLEIQFDNVDNNSILKDFYITSADTTLKVQLSEKPKQIIIDPNSWLLANIQEKSR